MVNVEEISIKTLSKVGAIQLDTTSILKIVTDMNANQKVMLDKLEGLEMSLAELKKTKSKEQSEITSAPPNMFVYVIQTNVYHMEQESIYSRRKLRCYSLLDLANLQ